MDSKTLCAHVAKQIDCDAAQVGNMLDAFAKVLCDRVSNLDSIAIPAFGNFVAQKLPERVQTDQSTGKRMMLPPQIKIEFVASSMLKKQLDLM